MSEHLGIYAVVLDPCRSNRSNLERMGKRNFLAHVIEPVVHGLPAVARLQDSFEWLIGTVYTFSPEDHSGLVHDGNLRCALVSVKSNVKHRASAS
ncbi:MAG: hypothetical protein M3Y50_12265 [Acidobacteriota bacterium]|nr:hypothetical protein [Acidobacteriota bacterium]